MSYRSILSGQSHESFLDPTHNQRLFSIIMGAHTCTIDDWNSNLSQWDCVNNHCKIIIQRVIQSI